MLKDFTFAQWFNLGEAFLWFGFAIAFLLRYVRGPDRKMKRLLRTLAITFAAFGISDVIEIQTGAWWTPWWLFLLKTVCLMIFIYCFAVWLNYYKK